MPLALQNFQEETCIHVDRRGKYAVTESRVERLLQLVKIRQKLAVVGVVVDVYLVSGKHRQPAIKDTFFL